MTVCLKRKIMYSLFFTTIISLIHFSVALPLQPLMTRRVENTEAEKPIIFNWLKFQSFRYTNMAAEVMELYNVNLNRSLTYQDVANGQTVLKQTAAPSSTKPPLSFRSDLIPEINLPDNQIYVSASEKLENRVARNESLDEKNYKIKENNKKGTSEYLKWPNPPTLVSFPVENLTSNNTNSSKPENIEIPKNNQPAHVIIKTSTILPWDVVYENNGRINSENLLSEPPKKFSSTQSSLKIPSMWEPERKIVEKEQFYKSDKAQSASEIEETRVKIGDLEGLNNVSPIFDKINDNSPEKTDVFYNNNYKNKETDSNRKPLVQSEAQSTSIFTTKKPKNIEETINTENKQTKVYELLTSKENKNFELNETLMENVSIKEIKSQENSYDHDATSINYKYYKGESENKDIIIKEKTSEKPLETSHFIADHGITSMEHTTIFKNDIDKPATTVKIDNVSQENHESHESSDDSHEEDKSMGASEIQQVTVKTTPKPSETTFHFTNSDQLSSITISDLKHNSITSTEHTTSTKNDDKSGTTEKIETHEGSDDLLLFSTEDKNYEYPFQMYNSREGDRSMGASEIKEVTVQTTSKPSETTSHFKDSPQRPSIEISDLKHDSITSREHTNSKSNDDKDGTTEKIETHEGSDDLLRFSTEDKNYEYPFQMYNSREGDKSMGASEIKEVTVQTTSKPSETTSHFKDSPQRPSIEISGLKHDSITSREHTNSKSNDDKAGTTEKIETHEGSDDLLLFSTEDKNYEYPFQMYNSREGDRSMGASEIKEVTVQTTSKPSETTSHFKDSPQRPSIEISGLKHDSITSREHTNSKSNDDKAGTTEKIETHEGSDDLLLFSTEDKNYEYPFQMYNSREGDKSMGASEIKEVTVQTTSKPSETTSHFNDSPQRPSIEISDLKHDSITSREHTNSKSNDDKDGTTEKIETHEGSDDLLRFSTEDKNYEYPFQMYNSREGDKSMGASEIKEVTVQTTSKPSETTSHFKDSPQRPSIEISDLKHNSITSTEHTYSKNNDDKSGTTEKIETHEGSDDLLLFSTEDKNYEYPFQMYNSREGDRSMGASEIKEVTVQTTSKPSETTSHFKDSPQRPSIEISGLKHDSITSREDTYSKNNDDKAETTEKIKSLESSVDVMSFSTEEKNDDYPFHMYNSHEGDKSMGASEIKEVTVQTTSNPSETTSHFNDSPQRPSIEISDLKHDGSITTTDHNIILKSSTLKIEKEESENSSTGGNLFSKETSLGKVSGFEHNDKTTSASENHEIKIKTETAKIDTLTNKEKTEIGNILLDEKTLEYNEITTKLGEIAVTKSPEQLSSMAIRNLKNDSPITSTERTILKIDNDDTKATTTIIEKESSNDKIGSLSFDILQILLDNNDKTTKTAEITTTHNYNKKDEVTPTTTENIWKSSKESGKNKDSDEMDEIMSASESNDITIKVDEMAKIHKADKSLEDEESSTSNSVTTLKTETKDSLENVENKEMKSLESLEDPKFTTSKISQNWNEHNEKSEETTKDAHMTTDSSSILINNVENKNTSTEATDDPKDNSPVNNDHKDTSSLQEDENAIRFIDLDETEMSASDIQGITIKAEETTKKQIETTSYFSNFDQRSSNTNIHFTKDRKTTEHTTLKSDDNKATTVKSNTERSQEKFESHVNSDDNIPFSEEKNDYSFNLDNSHEGKLMRAPEIHVEQTTQKLNETTSHFIDSDQSSSITISDLKHDITSTEHTTFKSDDDKATTTVKIDNRSQKKVESRDVLDGVPLSTEEENNEIYSNNHEEDELMGASEIKEVKIQTTSKPSETTSHFTDSERRTSTTISDLKHDSSTTSMGHAATSKSEDDKDTTEEKNHKEGLHEKIESYESSDDHIPFPAEEENDDYSLNLDNSHEKDKSMGASDIEEVTIHTTLKPSETTFHFTDSDHRSYITISNLRHDNSEPTTEGTTKNFNDGTTTKIDIKDDMTPILESDSDIVNNDYLDNWDNIMGGSEIKETRIQPETSTKEGEIIKNDPVHAPTHRIENEQISGEDSNKTTEKSFKNIDLWGEIMKYDKNKDKNFKEVVPQRKIEENESFELKSIHKTLELEILDSLKLKENISASTPMNTFSISDLKKEEKIENEDDKSITTTIKNKLLEETSKESIPSPYGHGDKVSPHEENRPFHIFKSTNPPKINLEKVEITSIIKTKETNENEPITHKRQFNKYEKQEFTTNGYERSFTFYAPRQKTFDFGLPKIIEESTLG